MPLVLTGNSSTLTVDSTNGIGLGAGSITFPNSSTQASAGSVLQVVQASYTAQWSGTPGAQSSGNPNANLLTTGFTISITPKFATSKIALMGQVWASVQAGTSTSDFLFKRGSTIISIGASGLNDNMTMGYFLNSGAGDRPWVSLPFFIYDTPATTNATTYTLFALGGNGTTFYLNVRSDSWSAGITNFIAMEIAA